MTIPLWRVDAFTAPGLTGNPAAVCLLPHWLEDARLQAIAAENDLPATAFFLKEREPYPLRWFSPTRELALCGHGTLASAHVVLHVLDPSRREVTFASKGGTLRVTRESDLLAIDFPAASPVPCPAPPALVDGLGRRPVEVLRALDYLAIFETEAAIRSLTPQLDRLAELDARGVIVSAPGATSDFVSRFFAPWAGIPEDPATGSAHTTLTPYWARRLGRARLHGRQLSARGGEFFCEDRGARVIVAGRAVCHPARVIDAAHVGRGARAAPGGGSK